VQWYSANGEVDGMKTPSHTPTPWMRNGAGISTESSSASLCVCAGVEGQENAAFIVRAVNSHQELMEALKNVRLELESETMCPKTKRLWAYVDQAIVKAGGK
jgi:hypothetical protein